MYQRNLQWMWNSPWSSSQLFIAGAAFVISVGLSLSYYDLQCNLAVDNLVTNVTYYLVIRLSHIFQSVKTLSLDSDEISRVEFMNGAEWMYQLCNKLNDGVNMIP